MTLPVFWRGVRWEYLEQYVSLEQAPNAALSSGGAVDPVTDEDIENRLDDGLAETLPEWTTGWFNSSQDQTEWR